MATLTFCGGAGSVTGANFLLEVGQSKILVDCGLTHGRKFYSEEDLSFCYEPSAIDVLLVTHAHADHIGKIPKLVRDGFRGEIISTAATKELSEVMLEDAVELVRRDARRYNQKPLYEKKDLPTTFSLWTTRDYHEEFFIGSDLCVFLKDAGHILGSAFVEITRDEKKIVFTGDLGNSPAPLLPDTEIMNGAHYLITESVYGNRNHEERNERRQKLRSAVSETVSRGGTLLIPTFALQRTQIMIYELNNMVEEDSIPEIPVYLDSPLAQEVTDVFRKYKHLYNTTVQREMFEGDDIFSFPGFVSVLDMEDSHSVGNKPGPKIVLASSGMSVGGRVRFHERKVLDDPKNMMLFVGYQAYGTLGREIQDGASSVVIDRKKVPVRCEIRTIRGYSGHKDHDNLLKFVESSKKTLEHVFVVMGEPSSSEYLAKEIREQFVLKTSTPRLRDVVEIDF